MLSCKMRWSSSGKADVSVVQILYVQNSLLACCGSRFIAGVETACRDWLNTPRPDLVVSSTPYVWALHPADIVWMCQFGTIFDTF
jgi:hypothetical protein